MIDTQAITVRLPKPLYEQLRKGAFDWHCPMNEIVVNAVSEWLKANAS